MLQRLLFIMSVTSATSGVLADGEQGDARGGKQHNCHTVRCDGRTGVGGGSSRGTGRVTGSGFRNLTGGGLGTGYSANSLDLYGLMTYYMFKFAFWRKRRLFAGSEMGRLCFYLLALFLAPAIAKPTKFF